MARGPVPPRADQLTRTTMGRQRMSAAPAHVHSRFGWLLLLLVADYLLSAFISATWVGVLQIVLFAGVVALAARSGQLPSRVIRWMALVLIGGSAAAATLALTHSADSSAGVANLWAALILLCAVVLIVRRVLMQQSVTLQSLYGAISAYMIIGLMFAALYGAMNKFSGGFFSHNMTGNLKTFQYFSFTTLTTLGYGDFTAASDSGRAVAVMEAMLGQVFLATLVARLVAAFRGRERPADGGATARASAGGPRRGRRYPGAGRPARPRARAAWPRSGATPPRTSSRPSAWPARRSRLRPGR
jgi:uncharacterized integral membrane protein